MSSDVKYYEQDLKVITKMREHLANTKFNNKSFGFRLQLKEDEDNLVIFSFELQGGRITFILPLNVMVYGYLGDRNEPFGLPPGGRTFYMNSGLVPNTQTVVNHEPFDFWPGVKRLQICPGTYNGKPDNPEAPRFIRSDLWAFFEVEAPLLAMECNNFLNRDANPYESFTGKRKGLVI